MIFVALVVFFLVGSVLMVLAIQNLETPVHIALFMWQTPDMPIGLLIVAAFLLGALLLYLVSMMSAWQDRRELLELQKRVGELERQQVMARMTPAAPQVNTGILPVTTGILPTLPTLTPMPVQMWQGIRRKIE